MVMLEIKAREARRLMMNMHLKAKSAHIGSGLSCVDFQTYVFQSWHRTGDRFILSKGHAASSLYAVQHVAGLLTREQIATYYTDGTYLPAHPSAGGVESIPVATGSLGHGVCIATGIAYANAILSKNDSRVCALLSDGECNEGSTWEAALFASQHRLKNLTLAIDHNGLQGFGKTTEVLALAPLAQKWEAFGFHVETVDGHDFSEIDRAMKFQSDKPKCLILKTIKGKGVSFMENKLEWHYHALDEAQYKQALSELPELGGSS